GVGLDPSPLLGEILVFPDQKPADRRAGLVDLRAAGGGADPGATSGEGGGGGGGRLGPILWPGPGGPPPPGPAGGGGGGAGAGLARGFLMYLNRTGAVLAQFPTLPNGLSQGDNVTSGPVTFSSFDPSGQVSGGDDQNFPFRGDDSGNGSGGPLAGGFEFTFGGLVAGLG